MLFKWVNRSIDILWSLNGGLVAVVACGWIWLGWRALSDRLARESRPGVGFARRCGRGSNTCWTRRPGGPPGLGSRQLEIPGREFLTGRARLNG